MSAVRFLYSISEIQALIMRLHTIQMRAQNQQDLIYKRGQTGITKASVTIVFDNSDKNNTHPAFEGLPQITVTRQVRRLIFYPLSQLIRKDHNRLHYRTLQSGSSMATKRHNKTFSRYSKPYSSTSTTPTSSSCKAVSRKSSTCAPKRF